MRRANKRFSIYDRDRSSPESIPGQERASLRHEALESRIEVQKGYVEH
jgi:hypothetical protein